MNDQDSAETISRYTERFKIHGVSPEALGWRRGTQEIRFAAFARGFGTHSPKSIIDLGCGFGDLLAFLRAQGWQGRYVGVDLVPEFIEAASERFKHDPDARWKAGDVLSRDTVDEIFDVCFASGLCNHRRPGGNREFIEALIARCAMLASSYFAIDFLSSTSDRRREDLFFMNPSSALEIGLRFSRRVELDHSYMPFEFMLKVRRDDAIKPGFPYFLSS